MSQIELGKYGIKGNTGLGGGMHLAAPYDCNGKVFVRVEDKEFGATWERVDKKAADESKIIRCCKCDKPAVSMDHLWPYYDDCTLCAEHFEGGER